MNFRSPVTPAPVISDRLLCLLHLPPGPTHLTSAHQSMYHSLSKDACSPHMPPLTSMSYPCSNSNPYIPEPEAMPCTGCVHTLVLHSLEQMRSSEPHLSLLPSCVLNPSGSVLSCPKKTNSDTIPKAKGFRRQLFSTLRIMKILEGGFGCYS